MDLHRNTVVEGQDVAWSLNANPQSLKASRSIKEISDRPSVPNTAQDPAWEYILLLESSLQIDDHLLFPGTTGWMILEIPLVPLWFSQKIKDERRMLMRLLFHM